MSILTFHAVSIGYHSPILQGYTLQVNAGERVGLWGHNGVGKSTLFRALTNEATVFSGSISKPENNSIAYLAQQTPHCPEIPLTTRDFLYLCNLKTIPTLPRLQQIYHRRLDTLSAGQRQFVKAWACLQGEHTQLILLDEPTTSLDVAAIDALATSLCTLSPHKAAVIISHDMAFLQRTCTRIMTIGTAP